MVISYNEKDLLSFGEYVQQAVMHDGLELVHLPIIFKCWLYHKDKARFEIKDLVSFTNHMLKRVESGNKKPLQNGEYFVSDADISEWIYGQNRSGRNQVVNLKK